MKPNLFIGSSSEGLQFAYALQSNLEADAEVTVWTQNVFRVGDFILESLLKQLDRADFGVFVFTADDVLRIRGEDKPVARDNVIFEFGLFVGQLGRQRSVIVAQMSNGAHLPSDFLGLNVLPFEGTRADRNWRAALGPAGSDIRNSLADIVPKMTRFPAEFELSIMERRDKLSPKQREILRTLQQLLPCSKADIAKHFHSMMPKELNYRLEHLRLLMFVTVREQEVYLLSDEFRRGLSENRIFPPDSGPQDPNGGR